MPLTKQAILCSKASFPMNAFSEMYDEGTELDARLEQASYLLKEAADESGVDLNAFSEEDLSGMLADIANSDEGPGEEGDDEEDDEEGGKTAADVTLADVTLELTKRAADEGIDLAQLDRETHEVMLNQVAAEMTDPAYFYEQQKVAAAYAQMDDYGRAAAHGFIDELQKEAANDDDDDDDDDEIDVKVKKAAYILKLAAGDPGRLRKAYDAAKSSVKGFGSKSKKKLQDAGHWAGKTERGLSERAGRASSKRPLEYNAAISRGRKVIGGTAAGAAAAGGGGYALARSRNKDKGRKKKASLDELAFAVDVLRAHGYEL